MTPSEQGVLVRAPYVPRGLAPRELPRAIETAVDAGRAQIGVSEHPIERRRHAFTVVGIDKQPGISNDFRQRAAVRHDNGDAGRHCLERGNAEPFIE